MLNLLEVWLSVCMCVCHKGVTSCKLSLIQTMWFVRQNYWNFALYNKKSRWFHACPDSIWEDNSRNCRLCHILEKPVGVRATSSLWECVDLDKWSLRAGHSRPFSGGKVPLSNSQPSTGKKEKEKRKTDRSTRNSFTSNLSQIQKWWDIFSRSKWVVLCDKWRINISMLFQTRKKRNQNHHQVLYTLHAREEYRRLSLSVRQEEETLFFPTIKIPRI